MMTAGMTVSMTTGMADGNNDNNEDNESAVDEEDELGAEFDLESQDN